MSTSVPDLASIVPAPAPLPAAAAGTAGGTPDGFATALKSASDATGGAAAPATAGGSSGAAGVPPSHPSGEQLQAIAGAPYAKIVSGRDAGQYLNQAAGNPRQGEAFQLEQRGGRTLHVYGSGADEIIEVIPLPTVAATGTSSSGTSSTGSAGTSDGDTSGSTSADGTGATGSTTDAAGTTADDSAGSASS